MSQAAPEPHRPIFAESYFLQVRGASERIRRMIAEYLEKGGKTQLVIAAINAEISIADDAFGMVVTNRHMTRQLISLWSVLTQDHWKNGKGSWHNCQSDLDKVIAEIDAILKRF